MGKKAAAIGLSLALLTGCGSRREDMTVRDNADRENRSTALDIYAYDFGDTYNLYGQVLIRDCLTASKFDPSEVGARLSPDNPDVIIVSVLGTDEKLTFTVAEDTTSHLAPADESTQEILADADCPQGPYPEQLDFNKQTF